MGELKKAVELNNADPTYTYGYAVALYSKHREAEAIAMLENSLCKERQQPFNDRAGLYLLHSDRNRQQKRIITATCGRPCLGTKHTCYDQQQRRV